MKTGMMIGKLAEIAGVNIETIRYYQRRGLLEEPDKPLGSQRRYTIHQLKRVRFIKRAQALGFTLAEVEKLLSLDQACACPETQALAAHKLELIEQKLADLQAMREVLSTLLQECALCNEGQDSMPCPIIDILARD